MEPFEFEISNLIAQWYRNLQKFQVNFHYPLWQAQALQE